ncbi:MAG: M1 family metallopeptidase [Bacteroidales bacterium]|nr:MAG: M1 family metallopeptidase [Bacteroidales bacterium]
MKKPGFLLKMIGFSIMIPVIFLSWNFTQYKERNEYPNSRIDTINVVHYTINLESLDFDSHSITGFTDIQIVLMQDYLDTIILDLAELVVDSVWIDEVPIVPFTYNGRWIRIPLPYKFDRGTSIQVTVFYHGMPVKDPRWGGFYFSDKTAFNMGVGMQSFPHNFGRVWYPCVDNFIDRATYDYFITVDSDLTVVCSGVHEETFINSDGTITYHWSMKHEIPTYLSSLAVSEYAVIRDTLYGYYQWVPSSLYLKPADSLKGVKTFQNLQKYLSHFENMFGRYAWDRVGFVTVPFRGGAMEHATNISINERSVDGTLDSELLLIHEFAHNWFGNLVTCQRAEDMWLNEGWASYSVALFLEKEYGEERFKNYVRENHRDVLRITHIRDNGYFPVYGIPTNLTYGSTVYDKGADIAHTLRGYLGDEKFFNWLKEYFRVFRYNDISTLEFRDFLSKTTETDLTDFFNSWVFSGGFPHYSIDSFKVTETPAGFIILVYFHQQLKGTDDFFYSNKIEVTFMDEQWHAHTEFAEFSGESSEQTFLIPFKPVTIMIDLDEQVSDATTDYHRILKTKGEYEFDATYCKVNVREITDSAFFRVVHNWIAPDDFRIPREDLSISKSRYWKIEGIMPDSFSASGSFFYNSGKSLRNGWLDPDLAGKTKDTFVMLYRKGPSMDWEICSSIIRGSDESGVIIVDCLVPGEYAVGYR